MAQNEQMTKETAIEILKANSYINYSKDELLEAVSLLKNDPERKDLLESFYKAYYKSLDDEVINYNEYKMLQDIFENTPFAEKLKADADRRANGVADAIKKGVKLSTFAELDNVQSLLRVVEQTDKIKEARTEVNKMIAAKMDEVLTSEDLITIHELPFAQHLVDNMEDEEKKAAVQKKINEQIAAYDEENDLDKDVEILRKNDSSLGEHLDDINLYIDGKISEEFKDFSIMVDNLQITEDDGTVLEGEQKEKHLTALFNAAKLEAHQENIGSIAYLMASKKKQREQLVAKVKDLFVTKIGSAGIASTFEQPTVEETQDEEKFKNYLKKRDEAAAQFIEKLITEGKKLPLKVKDIITACADTDIDISAFTKRLEEKIGAGKSVLGGKLKKFRDAAVNLWGKRYEIKRNVVQSIKENRWQHITNIGASVTMWGISLAASQAVLPAVAGYAIYSAAANYFWPLNAEAKKLRQKAEANGKKLGRWQALKEAWKIKKEDRSYKNRRRWGILGAAVGAGLGFGGFAMGTDVVAAKIGAGLARMTSSLSAQAMTYLGMRKDYKKDPSEENKNKLRSAKISLGVSAIISGVSSYLSLDRLNNSGDAALQTLNTAPAANGLPSTGMDLEVSDSTMVSASDVNGISSAQADSTVVAASGANAGNTPPVVAGAGDVNAEDYELPKAYDAKTMQGISPEQFKTLFKHANKQFIGDKGLGISGEEALGTAYHVAQNLTPEQLSAFGMKSPAELVYKFSRLEFELGRRPDIDALMDKIDVAFKEGDLKSLDEHLKHALDKGWISSDVAETKDKAEILAALDRKVLYVGEYPVDPAHPELGNIYDAKLKLEKLLNCQEIIQEGGMVTPKDLPAMKALLQTVDEGGQYRGIGWDKGMTHNVPNGGSGSPDCHALNRPDYEPSGKMPSKVSTSKVSENIPENDIEEKEIEPGGDGGNDEPLKEVHDEEAPAEEITPLSDSWGEGKEIETVVNVGRSSVNGHFFRENYLHTQIVNAKRFEGMINGQNAVKIEGLLPDGTRFVQVDMEDGKKEILIQKPGEEEIRTQLEQGQEGVINAQANQYLAVRDKLKGTTIATNGETEVVNGHVGEVKLPKGTLCHDQEGNTYVPGKKDTSYCVDADNHVNMVGNNLESESVLRDTRDMVYEANGLPKPKDGETVSQTILRAKARTR